MNRFPKDRLDQFETLARLSGSPIRDSQGKLVGRVTDFIVDLSEARLAYLSILLHPLNGGNKLRVTVPWSIVSLERGGEGGELRVAVRRKTLVRIAAAG